MYFRYFVISHISFLEYLEYNIKSLTVLRHRPESELMYFGKYLKNTETHSTLLNTTRWPHASHRQPT